MPKVEKVNNSDSSSTRNNTKSKNDTLDYDEYDDCKISDELSNSKNLFKSRDNLIESDVAKNRIKDKEKFTRNPISPMKRNINESMNDESPKKRLRMPNLNPSLSNHGVKSFNLASRLANTSDCSSPKKTSSNLEQKKTFASTPKTERKTPVSRIKVMTEQNSAAIERNMSNNWADIIEELEEQVKELNDYVEKVSVKYNLEKDKLMKNMECDAEVLRKRQKRINFGKVTPEYQRYILEISRKKREAYHPKTPNKYRKCSRRKFDGLVKKWRKMLHMWDENPDLLPEYKHSIENDEDCTDDFGGASNITASNFSYNVDDYDIIEDEDDSVAKEKLVTDEK